MKRLASLRDTQRVSSAFEPECPHPLCSGGHLLKSLDEPIFGELMKPCPVCARRAQERASLERVLHRDQILYIAICCALTVLGLGLAGAIYLVLTRI